MGIDVYKRQRENKKKIQAISKGRKPKSGDDEPGGTMRKTPAGRRLDAIRNRKD